MNKAVPLSIEDYFKNGQGSLFSKKELKELRVVPKVEKTYLKSQTEPLPISTININNRFNIGSNLTVEEFFEVIYDNNKPEIRSEKTAYELLDTISEFHQKPKQELKIIDALSMAQRIAMNYENSLMGKKDFNRFNKIYELETFGKEQNKLLNKFTDEYRFYIRRFYDALGIINL